LIAEKADIFSEMIAKEAEQLLCLFFLALLMVFEIILI